MNKTEEVLVSIRRVIRATDLQSKQLAKISGLTAPQIMLMRAINKHPNATIREIADNINLSQATVTTIIDRLEKRELVVRIRSQTDRRKVHVALTESGVIAIDTAPTLLQGHFVDRFSALAEWEQNMIIASLQRVAEMMDAQDIEAAPMLEVGALD